MINADNLKWIIPSKEHSTTSENCIRYIKAGQQYNMNTVDDEVIIQLINQYLCSLCIPAVSNPKVIPKARELRRFDYASYDTTSGKIISHLGESWDESYVFIFPLYNIPEELNRSDIESGIGNYLIANNIPIIDFYSHNY